MSSNFSSLFGGIGNIPIKTGNDPSDWGFVAPSAILAAEGAQPALTRTAVKTAATYTAVPQDLVPVDTTSNSVTVTLPTAPPNGTIVGVRTIIAGVGNTVTVATAGSDVFSRASGPTSATLTLPGQTLIVQYQASTAIWTPIGTDLPLAQLDLRYPPIVAKVITADATTTAQALADVTGLTFAVAAASTYEFEAILKVVASADTNGMKVGIACTQTPVSVAALVSGNTATTTAITEAIIAAATANATALNTSNAGIGIIRIKGQIVTHATLAGTLSIQHLKVTSGTSTVKVGSTLKVTKVA